MRWFSKGNVGIDLSHEMRGEINGMRWVAGSGTAVKRR